jgi:hypothetical protein
MSPRKRARFLATSAFMVGVAWLGSVACDWSEPSRADVEPLVTRHAGRDEVASKLGPGYTWYGPGGAGGLAEFLARERTDGYKPVRAAVQEGRRVMFYTTAWQQTWLFFDESDRLVGYWFNTQ